MKNILIIGAGISGLGAARVLLSRGCRVMLSDPRGISDETEREKLLAAGLRISMEPQTAELLSGIDAVIPSPVVPRENPAVAAALDKGIPVLSEIELAYRLSKAPILAITGTNGKTTATTLLGNMLEAARIPHAVAGNIGASLSEAASSIPEEGRLAAELSSFQLEFIKIFRPRAAAILNITPDHLERHHTMEAYVAAKARIFKNMAAEDALLLNKEDPYTPDFMKSAKAHIFFLSTETEIEEGACLSGGSLVLRVGGKEIFLCREDELKIRGHHNIADALAAAFLAYVGGVPENAICEALLSYTSLEHRIEFVRELHGVSYYNDSKATNTDAAVKALEAFSQPAVLIAGGHDKETPLEDFMRTVKTHARELILIGAAAPRFKAAAEQAGITKISMASSMKAAVEMARRLAKEGDAVLLSPACSSFDMYRSYGERGRDFKKIVEALE